uniref:Uncharacterized protein n=1 Tax=Arundo donax TaxID=35708 RepID=A0A0A9B3A3_ARUDO
MVVGISGAVAVCRG